MLVINLLNANPTKWSNTLKQFAGKSQRIASVCFPIFVRAYSFSLKLGIDKKLVEPRFH